MISETMSRQERIIRYINLFDELVSIGRVVFEILRDIITAASLVGFLRRWWKGRSPFDKWTMKVASAFTAIVGVPGVTFGVLTAAAIVSGGGVAPFTDISSIYYQAILVIVILFVALVYYMGIRLFVWEGLTERLRLQMPNDVVDQIRRVRS